LFRGLVEAAVQHQQRSGHTVHPNRRADISANGQIEADSEASAHNDEAWDAEGRHSLEDVREHIAREG
jgi:hypothetical protein